MTTFCDHILSVVLFTYHLTLYSLHSSVLVTETIKAESVSSHPHFSDVTCAFVHNVTSVPGCVVSVTCLFPPSQIIFFMIVNSLITTTNYMYFSMFRHCIIIID